MPLTVPRWLELETQAFELEFSLFEHDLWTGRLSPEDIMSFIKRTFIGTLDDYRRQISVMEDDFMDERVKLEEKLEDKTKELTLAEKELKELRDKLEQIAKLC